MANVFHVVNDSYPIPFAKLIAKLKELFIPEMESCSKYTCTVFVNVQSLKYMYAKLPLQNVCMLMDYGILLHQLKLSVTCFLKY